MVVRTPPVGLEDGCERGVDDDHENMSQNHLWKGRWAKKCRKLWCSAMVPFSISTYTLGHTSMRIYMFYDRGKARCRTAVSAA